MSMQILNGTPAYFEYFDSRIPIKVEAPARTQEKKRRHSTEVKREIDTRQTRLADTTRQLSESRARRKELVTSLDTLTTRLATFRAEGVHPSKYTDLTGYDFTDKAERKVHHEGSIEIITGEIERLDKRIALLADGVKKNTELCERELPQLNTELQEAMRLEQLGV
jgi:chromosome segregation ATPase